MKTNRQIKPTPKLSHERTLTTSPTPPIQHQYRTLMTTAPEKPTLASLFLHYRNGQQIRMICKSDISVHIQSLKNGRSGSFLQKSRLSSKTFRLKSGTPNLMRQCFVNYQRHSQMIYLFSTKTYQTDTSTSHSSRCDSAKRSTLSKNSSETSLKQVSSKASSTNKFPQQIQSESSLPLQNKDLFKKYLSQKNPSEKDLMFTVEELKESLQSDAKSSLKSNMDNKQNLKNTANFNEFNLNQHTLNYNYQQKLGVVQAVSTQGTIQKSGQLELEYNKNLSSKQLESTNYTNPRQYQNNSNLPNNLKQPQKQTKLNLLPADPNFSLTDHLRRGLIQKDHPLIDQQMSFKIAGDESIQKQKAKAQLSVYSMSHIQQLSSIISNAREDPFKKETEQQIDSIKYDLEDINKCFRVDNNEAQIQRLDLNAIAQKRQLSKLDDHIQITQKPTQQPNPQEYLVRHHVRFLQRKNERPQVIRLSPLRFRKKQEMIHQLVRAKIVSKESDSIVIP